MTAGEFSFSRHEDDYGIDEILFVDRLCTTTQEAQARAFLRLALIERYKTSDLSGDEWRFSAGLYLRESDAEWRLITNEISLKSLVASLYPALYGDFDIAKWPKEFFARKVGTITFAWKGFPIWSSSYDGKPIDLLVAAGHLPWAFLKSGDGGCDPSPLKTLCCQPGCSEPHVAVYRLKKRYCRDGHASDAGGDVRGFCVKHLRRGDCGLEDSDRNYEVVSGPGPDGHEPDPEVTKKSMFGGFV